MARFHQGGLVEKLVSTRNVEAEIAVLGGILLEQDTMKLVEHLSIDVFTEPFNRSLFAHLTALWQKGKPIDVTTAHKIMMKDRDESAAQAVAHFLAHCMDSVPVYSMIPEYVKMIEDAWRLRQMATELDSVVTPSLENMQKAALAILGSAPCTINSGRIEADVITTLLATSDIRVLVERNLAPEAFSIYRDVYEFITEYHRKYGKMPGKTAFKDAGIAIPRGNNRDQEFDALCDRMVEATGFMRLSEALMGSHRELLKKNVTKSQEVLHSALLDYQRLMSRSKDVDTSTDRIAREEYLKELEEKQGLLGYGCRWSLFTAATKGFRNGQFTIFTARPGIGKTTIACVLAADFVLQGLTTLFFSKEMSADEIEDRIVCILGKISWSDFGNGQFSTEIQEKMDRARAMLRTGGPLIIVEGDNDESRTELDLIAAKIEQYKPAVVIVDGAYMLEAEMQHRKAQSWELLHLVPDSLKRWGRKYKIPVIATNQLKPGVEGRRGLGISSLAAGDGWVRYADNVFALVINRDLASKNHMAVVALKTRHCKKKDFVIHFNPDADSDFAEERAQKHGESFEYDDTSQDAQPVSTIQFK